MADSARDNRRTLAPRGCAAAPGSGSKSRPSSSRTALRPVLSAIPISNRSARADSTSASSSASRDNRVGVEADLLRQPLRRSDQPRAIRSRRRSTPVRQHRRDARVRARSCAATACRRRRAPFQRRLHVPRFESHQSSNSAARSSRRAGSCTGARGIQARFRCRLRAAASASALGGVFVGERVDTDFVVPGDRVATTGYATWNASGEVRFARRTSAFITLDNLADREYMEPLGYPALGRTVRVRHTNEVLTWLDPAGGHFVERRQGLVRGIPPRTSRLRLRRGHHDVQRGRRRAADRTACARRSSRRRSSGWACNRSPSAAAWATYDEAFDRALGEAAGARHHARHFRRHPVRRAPPMGRASERRARPHGGRAALEAIDDRSLSRLSGARRAARGS